MIGTSKRVCFALVYVFRTCFPSPPRGAVALVTAHLINASTAVGTSFVPTLVIFCATLTGGVVAVVAHTLVITWAVFASGVGMASDLRFTLVDVGADLAVAAETLLAITLETAAKICAVCVLGTIV